MVLANFLIQPKLRQAVLNIMVIPVETVTVQKHTLVSNFI